MSLLDEAKKQGVQNEDKVLAAAQSAGKKKSNSEYQKKQRALIAEYSSALVAFVDKQKDVPADVKKAADFFAKRGEFERKAREGGFAAGPSVFTQLFGDTPKVGAKVTALDMFTKTHKGYGDMRKLIKKWAEKGTVVEFDETKQEYVLKAVQA